MTRKYSLVIEGDQRGYSAYRKRSFNISRAALCPAAPITPPPG
jgi:hypothetical protein